MARKIDVRCGSTKSRTEASEQFLATARKYPVLTADEEKEVIARIKRGDESAKGELVNANLRFLYSLATKFAQGEEVMDLISVATIGMMRAMDSYESNCGVRFLTYAVHWMRAEISEYFDTDAQLVRNKQQYKFGARCDAVSNKFFAENGRYPSESELVDMLQEQYNMEISSRSVLLSHTYSSLNSQIDEDGTTAEEVGEVAVATASRNEFEDEVDAEDNRYKVEKLLATLPIRSRTILEMSFGMGIYEGREMDDEAIAEQMGLTSERVRQIRVKSLVALKERAARILATA